MPIKKVNISLLYNQSKNILLCGNFVCQTSKTPATPVYLRGEKDLFVNHFDENHQSNFKDGLYTGSLHLEKTLK